MNQYAPEFLQTVKSFRAMHDAVKEHGHKNVMFVTTPVIAGDFRVMFGAEIRTHLLVPTGLVYCGERSKMLEMLAELDTK